MRKGRKIGRPLLLGLILVSLIAMILLDAFVIEPNWLKVETLEVRDPVLSSGLKGVRIVQLSDLHPRQELGFRERELVRKVAELKPDIIVITGDMLDSKKSLAAVRYVLSSLHATYGVYAVPGNSDYSALKREDLRKELASAGVLLLLNESRLIDAGGRRFWLAGVDDPVSNRDGIGKALHDVPEKEPLVLLAHSPDIYAKAVLSGVRLLLVGHTHGGQVGIPFLVRISPYANRSPHMIGIVHDGQTTMYVNRGIGTKALPIRFFCRPEITLVIVDE